MSQSPTQDPMTALREEIKEVLAEWGDYFPYIDHDTSDAEMAERGIDALLVVVNAACTERVNRAIEIHDIEQAIERLDVQCGEGTKCENCNRKLPRLKELQTRLAQLAQPPQGQL